MISIPQIMLQIFSIFVFIFQSLQQKPPISTSPLKNFISGTITEQNLQMLFNNETNTTYFKFQGNYSFSQIPQATLWVVGYNAYNTLEESLFYIVEIHTYLNYFEGEISFTTELKSPLSVLRFQWVAFTNPAIKRYSTAFSFQESRLKTMSIGPYQTIPKIIFYLKTFSTGSEIRASVFGETPHSFTIQLSGKSSNQIEKFAFATIITIDQDQDSYQLSNQSVTSNLDVPNFYKFYDAGLVASNQSQILFGIQAYQFQRYPDFLLNQTNTGINILKTNKQFRSSVTISVEILSSVQCPSDVNTQFCNCTGQIIFNPKTNLCECSVQLICTEKLSSIVGSLNDTFTKLQIQANSTFAKFIDFSLPFGVFSLILNSPQLLLHDLFIKQQHPLIVYKLMRAIARFVIPGQIAQTQGQDHESQFSLFIFANMTDLTFRDSDDYLSTVGLSQQNPFLTNLATLLLVLLFFMIHLIHKKYFQYKYSNQIVKYSAELIHIIFESATFYYLTSNMFFIRHFLTHQNVTADGFFLFLFSLFATFGYIGYILYDGRLLYKKTSSDPLIDKKQTGWFAHFYVEDQRPISSIFLIISYLKKIVFSFVVIFVAQTDAAYILIMMIQFAFTLLVYQYKPHKYKMLGVMDILSQIVYFFFLVRSFTDYREAVASSIADVSGVHTTILILMILFLDLSKNIAKVAIPRIEARLSLNKLASSQQQIISTIYEQQQINQTPLTDLINVEINYLQQQEIAATANYQIDDYLDSQLVTAVRESFEPISDVTPESRSSNSS